MKIAAFETIRIKEFPNILWVRIHTDEGIVGLGETFFMAETVEAYIHEVVAPKLLGRNPLEIDLISKDLTGYLGFRSTGVEMRGNSAVDIGLWDLFGKTTNLPIAQLLGGFSRREIRTYN
ncbi:MAG: mandelate racemase/muconate lactonizing enzyme family protein, partial [Rhizobium sp.]